MYQQLPLHYENYFLIMIQFTANSLPFVHQDHKLSRQQQFFLIQSSDYGIFLHENILSLASQL